MKRYFSSICCMVCGLTLFACTPTVQNNTTTSEKESVSEIETKEEKEKSSVQTEAKDAGTKDVDRFYVFEQGLTDLGYEYSRMTMAAEYIGALSGYKYETDSFDIEVYKYNVESENYKNIQSTESIYMDGFGTIPVYVNRDMVMIQSDAIPQEIVSLFQSV